MTSIGQTVRLTANVYDQNNAAMGSAVVTWSSSAAGVATVSAQGLVTAVANGSVTITARSGNASASIPVTVMQSAGSVVIEPSSATLMALGETVQLAASVLDGNGQPVAGAVVMWSSSEASVATVSGQGLVTAVSNGTAQITATSGSASASVTVIVSAMDDSRDREALIALYNSTDGPNWKVSTNWLSDAPLNQWHGVATNSDLQVTELILAENNLRGTIPPVIAQLQNLRYLSFWSNALTGSIPPEIGQLHNLRTLGLGSNALTGTIPSEIGQLQDLERLGLGSNALTGTIPPEIGQLSKLTWLTLNYNPGLTGPVPATLINLRLNRFSIIETELCVPSTPAFRRWTGSISNAQVIYCPDQERDPLVALYNSTDGANWTVATNWLSAEPLGEWHGVTTDSNGSVTALRLENNNLDGLIPTQLGDLASLATLDLSGNAELSGLLPRSLIKLDLEQLTLDDTRVCVPPDPEFVQWFGGIQNSDGTVCTDNRPDYYALASLYSSTNGPNWTNTNNWLSDEPLNTWYGVYTDSDGRVTELFLGENDLRGTIPPDLSELNNLRQLELWSNRLTGPIPPEIGQLQNLRYLSLESNALTGPIPTEIAQLWNLTNLILNKNNLTGPIPREIAQLQHLRKLFLGSNALTGPIPPEVGQLINLEWLYLSNNPLTGPIPIELAQLQNISTLWLWGNELTGSIPRELAQLQNLEDLRLAYNHLSGTIPSELGRLGNLTYLELSDNELTGSIPPELAQLQNLEYLILSNNQLTGNIPNTFGDLANLRHLRLTGNITMSGVLPSELIGLDLEELLLSDTGLCAPADPSFQDWLRRISNSRVENCVSVGRSAAYLTQATQSLTHPVGLVSGEDALLRVFVTTEGTEDVDMPPVRATFYQSGTEVHSVDIPATGTSIPRQIDEGDLSASANATVPGSVIAPGMEMVVEIDPDGTLDPALGVGGRLPPEGRLPVDVRDVPPLHLTLVPFLWTEDPDRSVLTQMEGLTADSDVFRLTRDILPVREFSLDVREPVWISFDPVSENMERLLRETEMVHTMDGAAGHYMGILRDGGGIAKTPGFVSASFFGGGVMAHELGHNFSLGHAPCGTDGDPNYPYSDGTIGAWGYDFLEDRLVSPDHYDLMSYCGPKWISDYYFSKALGYRASQAASMTAAYEPPTRSLLLWGGVDENEGLVLEPAFVVDAPAVLPQSEGPYVITGEDRNGGTLFRLSFGMAELSHADGGSFAYILPVRANWSRQLARVTLSGPEGVAEITGDGERSAVLLRDSIPGTVRGILRDWLDNDDPVVSGRRSLPEPGLEAIISRGLPSSADWER